MGGAWTGAPNVAAAKTATKAIEGSLVKSGQIISSVGTVQQMNLDESRGGTKRLVVRVPGQTPQFSGRPFVMPSQDNTFNLIWYRLKLGRCLGNR